MMNLGSLFKVVNKMKCVVPASAAQLPKHLVDTFVQSYMAGTGTGMLYTWTSLLRLAWLWSSRIFTTLAALLVPDLLGRDESYVSFI